MPPKMPSLGPPPKSSPLPKVLVTALIIGGLAGGIYWLRQAPEGEEGAPARKVFARKPPPPAPEPVVEEPAPPEPTVAELRQAGGLHYAQAVIHGPLETAIVEQVGREVGAALTQVTTRTLVWWIQVPGQIKRGDRLELLFEPRATEEPLVHAVRFQSAQTGRTHLAYRFKAEGDTYARMYEADGRELEERLQPTPIDDYEQITSILRDGRRHKGVDFKAAVGTPVRATFDGTVVRRNWNFNFNGNSLEIEEVGGRRRAIYLHLHELDRELKIGSRVKAGQVIAQSGNTGRSFAPHLHYQLMNPSEKVLDPFREHKTWRKAMAASNMPAFDAERARLEGLLTAPAATAAASP
jgi:murein DD-endopeptidase